MPSAKTAAVKVTFAGETRRVGSEFFPDNEWATFYTRCGELFENDFVGIEDGSAFLVTYKDSDGDTVTVRSTAEMQEAFHAQDELARFTISEQLPSPQQPPHRWLCRNRGAWWRLANGRMAEGENADNVCGGRPPFWARGGRGAGGAPAAAPRPHCWRGRHHHHHQGLPSVSVTPHRQGCHWAHPAALRDEAAQLNAEVVQLMEEKKFDEAARKLQNGLEFFPTHPNLWYNLACVEALRGERPGALAALQAAVQNGYFNADHASTDEDLVVLHSNPEFATIVACMRNRDATRYTDDHEAYLNSSLLSFRKEGAFEDAWKIAQQGVQLGVKGPLFLYNSACIASLVHRYEQAAGFLVEAVLAGYDDLKCVQSDEDFNNIRAHPDYLTAVSLLAQTATPPPQEDTTTCSSAAVQEETEFAIVEIVPSPDSVVVAKVDDTNVATTQPAVVAPPVTTAPSQPLLGVPSIGAPFFTPPVPHVVVPPVVPVVVPSAPPLPTVCPQTDLTLPTPRTASLMEMGFDRDRSKAALQAHNGHLDRAVNALLE